jgi:hypothetical protein
MAKVVHRPVYSGLYGQVVFKTDFTVLYICIYVKCVLAVTIPPIQMFVVLESMSDAGVLVGFSRDTALELAIQTMMGAAKLAKESKKHPSEVTKYCMRTYRHVFQCFVILLH